MNFEFDINVIKAQLDIPEDAYINKQGELVVDVEYGSCGHTTDRIRNATAVDKAIFLVAKELKARRESRIKSQELQQLAYLEQKYRNKD